MKRKSALIILAVVLYSFGFSQKSENSIKIYIGNIQCENKVEVPREQLIREGRLKILVNDKDTVNL